MVPATAFHAAVVIGEHLTVDFAVTYLNLNDRRISFYESKHGGWFARLVRRCTRRFWIRQVRHPIDRLFERGMISSFAYHEAHDYITRLVNCTPPPNHPRPVYCFFKNWINRIRRAHGWLLFGRCDVRSTATGNRCGGLRGHPGCHRMA